MHKINFERLFGLHLLRNMLFSVLKISLLIMLFVSCSKEKEDAGTASLIIINAVAGSKPLATNFKAEGPINYTNFQSRLLDYSDKVPPASTYQFRSYGGKQRLRLFQYPDTTEKDTPLFDLQLDLPLYSVNSLFLTGTLAAPDTVLSRDEIPYFQEGDSTMAIRFINLSPGSGPISINRKDSVPGSEVNNLTYKSMSEFKRYNAKRNILNYVFEFHDAVTGELLATYTAYNNHNNEVPSQWVYRSMTVVFQGLPGTTGITAPATNMFQHF